MSWEMMTPYSSEVRSACVARRQWVINFFPWYNPRTMLVLPISMASSMNFRISLQWNHVPGNNASSLPLLILHDEGAFPVDAVGQADHRLAADLDLNALPAQRKMRFPSRPQSLEA